MIREKLADKVYLYKNAIENPKEWLSWIEATNDMEDIQPLMDVWIQWDVDENRSLGRPYIYGYKKMCLLNDVFNIDKEVTDEAKEFFIKIRDTLFNAVQAVCEDYKEVENIPEDLVLLNQFGIHKYRAGTFMGTHHDSQEGDTRLLYSLVVWPNDDYEGGELSFTLKDGVLTDTEQALNADIEDLHSSGLIDFYVKPEAGSIIIFPSPAPYSHTAHLVKSKWKYMLPMFWIDPAGEDVLFKRDQTWQPTKIIPTKEELQR